MDAATKPRSPFLGPVLVVLGASMWGLESLWRLELARHVDDQGKTVGFFGADVLVFHEHWLGLLLTLPFLAFGWRGLRHVSRRGWISMLVSGVFGSAVGTVCFTQALTMMNPSVANLLLNLQPLVSAAASWAWLGERPRGAFYPWAAVAILCGVALAWDPEGLRRPDVMALGLLILSVTIVSWGVSTTAGRGAMLEIDFRTGVTLRYAIGAVTMAILLALRGAGPAGLNTRALATWPALEPMVFLLIFAAITPTFVYFAGLARTPASVATFAEMAQTFASLFITWGQLGHALTLMQCVAGVVLLVAVGFINRSVEATAPQSQSLERPALAES